MQSSHNLSLLAPYGSLQFTSLTTKVGETKGPNDLIQQKGPSNGQKKGPETLDKSAGPGDR